MKILIFLFFLLTTTHAQTHQDDVIILTLQHQKTIKVDSTLFHYFDNRLTMARETDDTLYAIHAFMPYELDELILQTSASWAQAWEKGELLTGNKKIDSLSTLFGLVNVSGEREYLFQLTYNQPLKIDQLSLSYEEIDCVIYASPNHFSGDGDRIEYFQKNGKDHFVFSKGWGDCPAGCVFRYYWYVEVDDSSARLVAENPLEITSSRFYTWNIPEIYSMTHFNSAGAIIDSIQFSDKWWIQQHSIEGSWQFFIYDAPIYYADENGGWPSLQAGLKSQVHQLLNVLEQAKYSDDTDVAASAEYAIERIRSVTTLDDVQFNPKHTILVGNYPNPFNPITRIHYTVGGNHDSPLQVSLKIYDVLGREVKTLVNKNQSAGEYRVTFDANNLVSGIYYYQLKAGDFRQTKKMLLLR